MKELENTTPGGTYLAPCARMIEIKADTPFLQASAKGDDWEIIED